MSVNESRGAKLAKLERNPETWDLLIIGGGITGAGIFNQAAKRGFKVLLIEQRDFGWGASSKSSKMIHGGIRYLAQGNILLTWHAAREREYLMRKYPALIEPLPFLFPLYRGRNPPAWLARVGIIAYDLLAGHWDHSFWTSKKVMEEVPSLLSDKLKGAIRFTEASTDDVRLVIRLLREGAAENSCALNYMEAEELIRTGNKVCGAVVRDAVTGRQYNIKSRLVINATGAWTDGIRKKLSAKPRMRPLRGSHLLFSAERFPLRYTVSYLHPMDGRPVFACPWHGATMVGTTDLDHGEELSCEPSVHQEEVDYLLKGVSGIFPGLGINQQDVLSAFAGVRPVISSGKQKPSQESRDSAVWLEQGLLTVTGGKLTTFRLTAHEALAKASHVLRGPDFPGSAMDTDSAPAAQHQDSEKARLSSRYGTEAADAIIRLPEEERQLIPNTSILWGELRWAARNESVIHLDDLLIRRTRAGLLLPCGGMSILDKVKKICLEELRWDREAWETEKKRYCAIWQDHYSVPGG